MRVRQSRYYRHYHWERCLLVHLENIEEVVVLEEAHGTIGDLEMAARNALDYPLEDAGHQDAQLIRLADLQDLLQLRQEQRLLQVVRKWPVLEDSLQQLHALCMTVITGIASERSLLRKSMEQRRSCSKKRLLVWTL